MQGGGNMDREKLKEFLEYCDKESKKKVCALFDHSASIAHKGSIFRFNIMSELYIQQNELLMELIAQPCEHRKLIELLNRNIEENEKTNFWHYAKQRGIKIIHKGAEEPLIKWIADYNYWLAYPMCNSKEDVLTNPFPERVLSYVYIYLEYSLKKKNNLYSNEQPDIKELYDKVFNKSSELKKWGLLPVNQVRKLYTNTYPVRIYDSNLNKTLLVQISSPLAKVFKELYEKHYIYNLAIRPKDFPILDGENYVGILQEAVERGSVFFWSLDELPAVTRLYNGEHYEDCLWIKSEGEDITFEELCQDFHEEGEYVVTQMIHLQHSEKNITHIDHEYIFYNLDEYEERKFNPKIKGEEKKRVKTFKIDHSNIPMDYACKMNDENKEIEVPFTFFVLNNFFEHKDLLAEYFKKIK